MTSYGVCGLTSHSIPAITPPLTPRGSAAQPHGPQMPNFTDSTPTRAVTLGGLTVKAPESFTSGDVLDAHTSRFLNSAVISAVGKNLMNAVKKELDETNKDRKKGDQMTLEAFLTEVNLQARFDAAFASYTPGAISRGGGKEPTDPVEARIAMLALAAVKSRIVAKGGKVHTFATTRAVEGGPTKLAELVAAYSERFDAELRAQAEAQLAAEADRDDFDIGDIDADDDADPTEGEGESAAA